jgi:hypothetical protein
MDNIRLNDEQYSTLVDFLFRWGLKSPELISEMADHYSEKAVERMSEGHSWPLVLKSFKTKETYMHLRKLQSAHERLYWKRWWVYVLDEIKLMLTTPLHLLFLGGLIPLLYLSITNDFTAAFMPEVIAAKAIIITGLAVYFAKFHKTTKRSSLLNSGRYFYLVLINFVYLHLFISHFITNGYTWEGMIHSDSHAWIWAILVVVSVVLDIVTIRFVKRAQNETSQIHPAVLERVNQ